MKLTSYKYLNSITQITKMKLTLPFPHYADLLRLACEAVGISAEDLFLLY